MADKSFLPRDDLKIWINGRLVPTAEAAVNVFDHGLLYGDGVFEGVRVYDGRVFAIEAHVERLFASARTIRLTIPVDRDRMIDAIRETVAANNINDGYVRPIVTRGMGYLGLSPLKTTDPQIIIIADSVELYSANLYQEGMEVITSRVVRTDSRAIPAHVKSMNYLNNILAKIEALEAGVPEAIMFNHDGNVAEATGDNVFVVSGGVVRTPPANAGILIGITRGVVLEILDRLGLPFAEADINRDDLLDANECFLTGTAAEIIGVTVIDSAQIGDGKVGPVTRKIMDDFHRLIRDPDYSPKWRLNGR
jgi:branched-chain amino acid aminotransferase